MSSSSGFSKCSLEDLDTEFNCDIKSAKRMLQDLKRPKDRGIASQLIKHVEELDSNSLEVKSNRNIFTRYFLKVLKKTIETQPPQYDQWFKRNDEKEVHETQLWSPDRRTFVATKNIPDFGMLVYLAVTYEPELGWQENGFLSYKF